MVQIKRLVFRREDQPPWGDYIPVGLQSLKKEPAPGSAGSGSSTDEESQLNCALQWQRNGGGDPFELEKCPSGGCLPESWWIFHINKGAGTPMYTNAACEFPPGPR